jgi:hypothetical protein
MPAFEDATAFMSNPVRVDWRARLQKKRARTVAEQTYANRSDRDSFKIAWKIRNSQGY